MRRWLITLFSLITIAWLLLVVWQISPLGCLVFSSTVAPSAVDGNTLSTSADNINSSTALIEINTPTSEVPTAATETSELPTSTKGSRLIPGFSGRITQCAFLNPSLKSNILVTVVYLTPIVLLGWLVVGWSSYKYKRQTTKNE